MVFVVPHMFFINWFIFVELLIFKLEEELLRARYVLSEGDAAAFLPGKTNGLSLCFCAINFVLICGNLLPFVFFN